MDGAVRRSGLPDSKSIGMRERILGGPFIDSSSRAVESKRALPEIEFTPQAQTGFTNDAGRSIATKHRLRRCPQAPFRAR